MEPASPAHTERCTIVVTPRDLFSVTDECLDHLAAHTPEAHDLIVAMGGAPAAVRAGLGLRTLCNRFTTWRTGYYRA